MFPSDVYPLEPVNNFNSSGWRVRSRVALILVASRIQRGSLAGAFRSTPEDDAGRFASVAGRFQQTQRWIRAGCFEIMVEDLRSLLREFGSNCARSFSSGYMERQQMAKRVDHMHFRSLAPLAPLYPPRAPDSGADCRVRLPTTMAVGCGFRPANLPKQSSRFLRNNRRLIQSLVVLVIGAVGYGDFNTLILSTHQRRGAARDGTHLRVGKQAGPDPNPARGVLPDRVCIRRHQHVHLELIAKAVDSSSARRRGH